MGGNSVHDTLHGIVNASDNATNEEFASLLQHEQVGNGTVLESSWAGSCCSACPQHKFCSEVTKSCYNWRWLPYLSVCSQPPQEPPTPPQPYNPPGPTPPQPHQGRFMPGQCSACQQL